MNQPSLVQEATDSTVKRPSNNRQWQVVRDDAAPGSGKYYGYDNLTGKELIGGPATGVGSQVSVEVSYDSATRILTATPSGGVGAYTYSWTMKSFTSATGEHDATFTGATNASTAEVTANIINTNAVGMACVKVTDSIGRSSYGFYAVRLAAAN